MVLAVTIRYEIQDIVGKKSFTKVRVPTGTTIAQYTGFAQAMAQLIADVNTGVITRAGVCVSLDLSGLGLKALAAAGSDVAEKLQWLFNTAVTGFKAKLRIPGLDDQYVVEGSNAIDLSDPDVMALETALVDGQAVTAGTISATNGRGHDITGTSTAKQAFRTTL